MASATVHLFKKPNQGGLECSACGASANAACDCGVPYVPASTRAAAAVAATPEKSDRAIAKEIGVNNATVSRARKQATVAGATVAKRTGLDGKRRKMPEASSDAETALSTLNKLYSDLGKFSMSFSERFEKWNETHGAKNPELRQHLAQGLGHCIDTLRDLQRLCTKRNGK